MAGRHGDGWRAAGGLLALLRTSQPWFTDEELEAIEAAEQSDPPPEDKWAAR